MPADLIILLIGSLVSVLAVRLLPKHAAPDGVAVISAVCLIVVSWQSALWLAAGIAITLGSMIVGERMKHTTPAFVAATLAHVVLLLFLRDLSAYVLVGGAYFTLRHIHVLSDWWTEDLKRPSFRDYARYHFFLPVLAAGPIHRYMPFQRQITRRRNDPDELVLGAERLLWGAFQFTVLGGWLMGRTQRAVGDNLLWLSDFPREWILSALHWITLYLSFGGLSSMAIGLSLMMGIRIEENFREPWKATDLIDFWKRWHMTLTGFSRDYVFKPISAVSRSAALGTLASMVFIGVWHASSIYWTCWGVWQGLGILLTMHAQKTGHFSRLPTWMGRGFAALWLTASLPVISLLADATP